MAQKRTTKPQKATLDNILSTVELGLKEGWSAASPQSPKIFELQGALAEIAAFFATVHAAGVTPLSVGGDHSISLPILRAIARDGPLGMVHVDAHCDTGDDYLGSRFHHGASFRRAVEERIDSSVHTQRGLE